MPWLHHWYYSYSWQCWVALQKPFVSLHPKLVTLRLTPPCNYSKSSQSLQQVAEGSSRGWLLLRQQKSHQLPPLFPRLQTLPGKGSKLSYLKGAQCKEAVYSRPFLPRPCKHTVNEPQLFVQLFQYSHSPPLSPDNFSKHPKDKLVCVPNLPTFGN